MTWSITKSRIVGGDAIVKWNDTPLRQLGDDEFRTATEAANALGECVMLDATGARPGLEIQAARADLIVRAVMKEMERRQVVASEGVRERVNETRDSIERGARRSGAKFRP